MIELYGIETCDTCKKVRRWLAQHDVAFAWTDLRATPPSSALVARWIDGLGALALRNTSGKSYRALGEEKDTWGDAEWLAAFSGDPMLIKRPVLSIDGRAVLVGFNEAKLRSLF